MTLINTIANAPAIGLRFLSHTITVATALSVIATTISMTVVITKVAKSLSGSDNTLIKHTVIAKTESELGFNRDIFSYEFDYYFNATEALFTLVDQINNHLQESFPNHFIKIIVSQFSLKPETNFTVTRKRRHDDNLWPSESSVSSSTQSTSQTTLVITITESTESSSSTSSTITDDFESISLSSITTIATSDLPRSTSDIEAIITNSSQNTTTSTIIPNGTYSTTLYSYSDSSTTTFSTTSSLSSLIITTVSKPFLTTSMPTTPLQTYHINNCTISTSNSTKRPSLVYINGTLYFNVTSTNDITVKDIIDALNKLFPPIELIDQCGSPSTANGYFNVTRSNIPPLTETNLTAVDLNALNSIPSSLIAEVNAVTTPPISIQSVLGPTTLPTFTTETTTATTIPTTTSTQIVTTSNSTFISTSTSTTTVTADIG